MTSQTIGQFGFRNGIIFVTSAMTVQTPTHVHCLRHGGDHLADLSVAILTINTGGNMGTVAEGYKIRQKCNRHPGYGLVVFGITCQNTQSEAGLGIGTGVGDLLMAGIA
jgi:hypothetical protein